MDHPGRELEAELAVGVQQLSAARPQPGRVRHPMARLDAIARRMETQRLVGRQRHRRRIPARAACGASTPDQPGTGSGPSCGRYRQNVTTQPSLVTGWSTGSGSTLGKPISGQPPRDRTEVASRVTESGDVTGAIRATASAAGR